MHWLLSFTIFVVYAGACLGWGLLLAQAFGCHRIKNPYGENFSVEFSIRVASSFLTGIGVIFLLFTALGLSGLLRPLPLILALLPGALGLMLSGKLLRDCMDASIVAARRFWAMPLWLLLIGGVTAFLVLSCGIGAWILPPKGDAAAFYMVYPKIVAATGLLEPMHGPFYFFSAIGLPIEIHYSALMILADEHAAKFFIFPIAVSAAVILAGIVRLCSGGTGAVILSWAMLFSSYTFHHYIYDGKVDLAAAAFGLASVYWLFRGTISRVSVVAYWIAGWFAGLATVAKFSYLLVLGVSLLTLLLWLILINRQQGTRLGAAAVNLARVGGVMGGAALVAWIPQLVKNGVLFDAPLAPFFGGQVDGNLLSQVWFSPEDTRKILLTYPFALVFGRYPMQGGGLSFLFLAFLPFLFWLARPMSWRASATAAVTFSALAGVGAWMLLRPSVIAPRYILVSLLLLVPILAIAAEGMLAKNASNRVVRAGTTLTVLLALFASFWHLLPIPNAILYRANSQNNDCLLASSECDSFRKLAEIARPGDRIFVASYYPYWLTPSQLQCRDTLDEQREIPDQAQLLSWLRIQGFNYVIVDPTVSTKLYTGLQQLSESNASEVTELHEGRALRLFRIRNDMAARVRCIESPPGRWTLQRDPL